MIRSVRSPRRGALDCQRAARSDARCPFIVLSDGVTIFGARKGAVIEERPGASLHEPQSHAT